MQILKEKIKGSRESKYMDQIDQDFNFLIISSVFI